MIDALRDRPESTSSVWLVGEADDWIEAAFTDRAAADAHLATKSGDSWWVQEIPLFDVAPSTN